MKPKMKKIEALEKQLKSALKETKVALKKGTFGTAYIHGSDKPHKVIDVIDSGKPSHEPEGGNHYILKDPDGKKIKIHQSKLKSMDLSKAQKGYMSMLLDDLIAEHKNLVEVLKSGKKKELHKEMLEQKAELEDYIRRKKEVAKADDLEGLKARHRLPKEPSNKELTDKMKRKYSQASTKSPSVESIKAKNIQALK